MPIYFANFLRLAAVRLDVVVVVVYCGAFDTPGVRASLPRREPVKIFHEHSLEELSPGALGIISLRGGFLLHRDELIAELFCLTPDFIF